MEIGLAPLLVQVCAPLGLAVVRATVPRALRGEVSPPLPPLKLAMVVLPLPSRVSKLLPLLTVPPRVRGLLPLLSQVWALLRSMSGFSVTAPAPALIEMPVLPMVSVDTPSRSRLTSLALVTFMPLMAMFAPSVMLSWSPAPSKRMLAAVPGTRPVATPPDFQLLPMRPLEAAQTPGLPTNPPTHDASLSGVAEVGVIWTALSATLIVNR